MSPKFPSHKVELSYFRLWIFFKLTIWLRSFPGPFLVPPPLSCLKVSFSWAEYTDLTRFSFPHHPLSREMRILLFAVYSTCLQIYSGKPNGGSVASQTTSNGGAWNAESKGPGLGSWFCCSLAIWPDCQRHLNPLNSGFFISEMETWLFA